MFIPAQADRVANSVDPCAAVTVYRRIEASFNPNKMPLKMIK